MLTILGEVHVLGMNAAIKWESEVNFWFGKCKVVHCTDSRFFKPPREAKIGFEKSGSFRNRGVQLRGGKQLLVRVIGFELSRFEKSGFHCTFFFTCHYVIYIVHDFVFH